MNNTDIFSEYFTIQTTVMDLVAVVSESSSCDAETIQVISHMLQNRDFWYDGTELN